MASRGRNLTDAAAAIRAALTANQGDFAAIYLREAAKAVASSHPTLAVTTESADTAADEALIQLSKTALMIVVGGSQVTPAGRC